MKHITMQIRDFLTLSGKSARSLAEASGVSAANISRMKNGRRKDMGSRYADALREAMLRLDPEAAARALEDELLPRDRE